MAAYNAEKTIEKCLSSIEGQSGVDAYQLIIVDGASKDRTLSIVKKYEHCIDLIITEPDDGVYDAWNKAVKHISCDWVMFLGADDCFISDDSLTIFQKEIDRVGKVSDFLFCKVALVENIITDSEIVEILGDEKVSYYQDCFTNELRFSHTGCLHRSELFVKHGEFNSDFKIAGDYEFMLRCVKDNPQRINKIDSILVEMSSGGLSSSINSKILTYKEALSARRINKVRGVSLSLYNRLIVAYISKVLFKTFGEKGLLWGSNIYRRVVGKKTRDSYQ